MCGQLPALMRWRRRKNWRQIEPPAQESRGATSHSFPTRKSSPSLPTEFERGGTGAAPFVVWRNIEHEQTATLPFCRMPEDTPSRLVQERGVTGDPLDR